MQLLEIGAVILSMLGVWLTAQRRMLCWPVGLASVLLYGWIFWHVKLYSDMLLQGIYAVFAMYGWWHWSQHVRKHHVQADLCDVHIMLISRRVCMLGLLSGATGSLVLGVMTATFTDAALPWIDATLTCFSLVAEFWKIRRYIAHWRLWIVVDSVYVVMFAFKGLSLTAALYAGFIILAWIGLKNWQRSYRQHIDTHPPGNVSLQ